jgi:type III pantothenate kinase
MNLILDIGNTLQKIAVFNNDECVYCQSFPLVTEEVLRSILNQFSIKHSIISSVAELDAQVIAFLNTHTKMIHYTHQTKLPVTILYKNAATLGLDRIANAVGAVALFPFQHVLSVQAGTCLVLDFVNAYGEYLGGSISPGIKMRFEILHEKTKNLPLVFAKDTYPNFLETDTQGSLSSGVINGMCHEIDGFIEDYRATFENLKVILTGGDAAYLQKSIKNTIFAAPNMVLKGLNEIIKYNV